MGGSKIIEGLKDAVAGNLSRVTIGGETWAKVNDIHADQQEIMRINNSLRDLGNELAGAAGEVHPTAPSSASIDRLHRAIDAWDAAVSRDTHR